MDHCWVGVLLFSVLFIFCENRFLGQVNVSFFFVDPKDSENFLLSHLHDSMDGFGHDFGILIQRNHSFFHVVLKKVNVASVLFRVFNLSLWWGKQLPWQAIQARGTLFHSSASCIEPGAVRSLSFYRLQSSWNIG